MASSLPFDFFAGLARRIASPRVAARHAAAPLPLSRVETLFYAALAAGLSVALVGVIAQHRTFLTVRVQAEEIERQSRPELMGDLICEENRVIGISIQRVFETTPRHAPRALPLDHRVLDGALAAAQPAIKVALPANGPLDPVDGEPAPVVLQRPATWHTGEP